MSPAELDARQILTYLPKVMRPTPTQDELVTRAREIHERVLILDAHVDFSPVNLTSEPSYTERLETQCNLPKMIEGGVDALFFVVYVGQTRESRNPEAFQAAGFMPAYSAAMKKFDAIHHFARVIAPERVEVALGPGDVRRIRAHGKKAALIGVENGYPIGEEIQRIEEFYNRGARYLSLTHNGHNQLADSHTGEREGWKWNGLSPLGKKAIGAMNKCGMMVDVSHLSKASMMQAAALSKAPIIASHSAIRALCNVSRNLDDEQLRALKDTGGVIQIVAYDDFIKTPTPASPQRNSALAALRREYGLPEAPAPGQREREGMRVALARLSERRRAEFDAKLAEIDRLHPGDSNANVADFVEHIDYAVTLLGIDHVGIASDFDGGGGIGGWDDASETFNVTCELVRRGYSEEQIGRLWGGNLLRLMDEVRRRAG